MTRKLIGPGAQEAIVAYIRAKDENRPHLMRRAFDEGARLRMVVRTEAISFPPGATGREAITDILVRGFAKTYENVRTFCLSQPPGREHDTFSCGWLVGMSAKEDRTVRVGCGLYAWRFQARSPYLAEELTITVEVMEMLPAASLFSVMDWLDELPYPWCSRRTAFERTPIEEGLRAIRHWLAHDDA